MGGAAAALLAEKEQTEESACQRGMAALALRIPLLAEAHLNLVGADNFCALRCLP
jgi:hypothetical protein